jgi:hypothetical protein
LPPADVTNVLKEASVALIELTAFRSPVMFEVRVVVSAPSPVAPPNVLHTFAFLAIVSAPIPISAAEEIIRPKLIHCQAPAPFLKNLALSPHSVETSRMAACAQPTVFDQSLSLSPHWPLTQAQPFALLLLKADRVLPFRTGAGSPRSYSFLSCSLPAYVSAVEADKSVTISTKAPVMQLMECRLFLFIVNLPLA